LPIVVSALTTFSTQMLFGGQNIRVDEASQFFDNYFSQVTQSSAARAHLRHTAFTQAYANADGHSLADLNRIWGNFDSVSPNVFKSDNDRTSGDFQVQLTDKRGNETLSTYVYYTLQCDAWWARWPLHCPANHLRIRSSLTTHQAF
jgi:hypothetical protein